MFRRPRRTDDDFADEVRSHIELEEARLVERGVSPDEARRRARVAFGSTTNTRERFRESSPRRWLETLWQDIRYGARLLKRSPAFAVTAIVVLSLGIGINTALFSIISSIFFRDLHVKDVERLVYLNTRVQSGEVMAFIDPETDRIFRTTASELADFTSHNDTSATVTVDDETSILDGEIVEANYFDLLGVDVERGRAFSDGDNDRSNPESPVVISHDFWVKRLAGDPAVLQRTILITGHPFRIVGIAPKGFRGLASPFRPSMWWVPRARFGRGESTLASIARVKAGVDIETFRAFVDTKAPELVRLQWEQLNHRRGVWPWEVFRQRGFSVASVADVDIPHRPSARLVPPAVIAATMTVSALVLVIACANVAGLLLARGTARTGEVAVRQALGAGGARLFRQIVTESVLVAGVGATAGVAIAIALVRLFGAVTPESLSVPVSIDIRVLAFAAGGALATGLLVGLAPALQASRVQLLHALGAGVVGSRRTGRSFNRWIVIPQVTIAAVLLLVAAVHVRALLRAEQRDRGYRTDGTMALRVNTGNFEQQMWNDGVIRIDASTDERDRAFARTLIDALEAMPGLDGAAAISQLDSPLRVPVGGEKSILGREASPASRIYGIELAVSNGYFSLMGMHLLSGRTFDEREKVNAAIRTAIVSESVARAFGGPGILGHSIALEAAGDAAPNWLEVVGIVNDVVPVLEDGRPHPIIYVALGQQGRPSVAQVLVRARDRATAVGAVKRAILTASSAAQVNQVYSLDGKAAEILYPRRLASGILVAAAAVALLLASIGLYGIVSFTAAQRQREFGIRATLGATPFRVLALALKDGTLVLCAGLGLGVVLGAIALRASVSVVQGPPAFDAAVFLTIPLVLATVVLAASLLPALRASRVDPAVVLRGE